MPRFWHTTSHLFVEGSPWALKKSNPKTWIPNYQRSLVLTLGFAHPSGPFGNRNAPLQAKNLSPSLCTQKQNASEVRTCHLLPSLSLILHQGSRMANSPSSSKKSAGKPEKPPVKQPVSQVLSILKAYWIPLALFAFFVLFQLILLPNSFPPSHYEGDSLSLSLPFSLCARVCVCMCWSSFDHFEVCVDYFWFWNCICSSSD